MKLLLPGFLMVVASSAFADEPQAKGLTVHEWGVFRVNSDSAFANADLRAEWDDLPEFIYGYVKGRLVPQHWGAFEIRRKPIIFFHAIEPTKVHVKVEFPGGQAGVWFPATMNPAVHGQQKQPAVGNTLEWDLGIKERPIDWQIKNPKLHEVPEKHWISRLRQVKSDTLFSKYSPNNLDVEQEKFIYYDGIFPQGKWLSTRVEKENVELVSQVKHPLFDVTVVDRRGEKVRVGRIAKLDSGERIKAVEFVEFDSSKFNSEASRTLLNQLTLAGLNPDEAGSLVELWQKEFFETPGLNLFYRLPQEEYDARLPLTITPKPSSQVRVGLVYHAHLETDFAETVLDLVRQLDSARFAVRDAAMKKLVNIGPAALVQLLRLRDRKDLSIEVRERIDILVRKWNAKDAFEEPDIKK